MLFVFRGKGSEHFNEMVREKGLPSPTDRLQTTRQVPMVNDCQYLGPHIVGKIYDPGIWPILPTPLTIAMAAARLTGGRGIQAGTQPARMIPPERTEYEEYTKP
jgi:hypothetical protein